MAGRNGELRLTHSDMVLVGLYYAAQGTTNKVPYEELVLELWRRFPGDFSLRNHPEHPDASDVHKRLSALKPDGLVVALGNKIFRLTDKGLQRAKELIEAPSGDGPDEAKRDFRLSREEETFIKKALAGRSFATWKADQRDRLIDYDARLFFQFSTVTPQAQRRTNVEFAKLAIEKACTLHVEGAEELWGLALFLETTFGILLEGD